MADFESAKVEGIFGETSKANDVIQISMPSTQQAFVIEKTSDILGHETYRVNPVAYSATAPSGVTVPVSEALLTPEQKEKLKKDVEEFLAKSGEEAKRVAESLKSRLDAYLEARKRSSEQKLSEGVSKW
jgi:hypothetical protein